MVPGLEVTMPDKSFWNERWEKNELGFHALDVNPHLQAYIEHLTPTKEEKILVPLCGKTLDLLYLSQRFGEVWGVEYIEKAAIDFFAEHNLDAACTELEYGKIYQAKNIHIVVADIFSFLENTSIQFDALYDRASLIALEEEPRKAYAQKIQETLKPRAKVLLIALDYPQEQMPGPPFSVAPEEIDGHFEGSRRLTLLSRTNIIEKESKWRERGVSCIYETVFTHTT